ncbi:hypothetical protein AB0B66_10745 [Catellatospora sp. NPDC049111]|uniref:hypothetical protein n=1 Tax=Catellatospora sp. NPDC049111 TaxID=3155271 RepID=UPI003407ECEB
MRASAYYGFFGVSGAIGLQFQSQENAADSFAALVSPIAVIAGLTLAAAAMHRAIKGMISQTMRARSARLVVFSISLMSAVLVLMFLIMWLPHVLLSNWSGSPGWPVYLLGSAGVLLYNYASHLRNQDVAPLPRETSTSRLSTWASSALVMALMLAATGSYASNLGFQQALRATQEHGWLKSVTIYSKESQSLTGPGITTTELSVTDGYKYRYTGLRLLAVRGNQFIVVPEAERFGPPTAILVTDGEGIRIEIS